MSLEDASEVKTEQTDTPTLWTANVTSSTPQAFRQPRTTHQRLYDAMFCPPQVAADITSFKPSIPYTIERTSKIKPEGIIAGLNPRKRHRFRFVNRELLPNASDRIPIPTALAVGPS